MDLRDCWQSGHKKTRSGPRPSWTGPGFLLLLWICLGCSTAAADESVKDAEFNFLYNGTATKKETIYKYVLKDEPSVGVRVTVMCDSTDPILVDVRQKEMPMSFRVPLLLRDDDLGDNQTYLYAQVSRTLCLPPIKGKERQFYVDVSTLSVEGIPFQLNVSYVEDFTLQTNKNQTFTASPSQPQYFKYEFVGDVSSVIVNVSSLDTVCTVLSIQDIQCPVYDLNTNVDFTGRHQTITRRGAITVQKKDFKSFYVVVVVMAEDEDCGVPFSVNRTKTLHVMVSPTSKQEDYAKGIVFCVGIFLAFYPLTILWGYLEAYLEAYLKKENSTTRSELPQVEAIALSTDPDQNQTQESGEEDENREEFLFVSALDRHKGKTNAYIWNIITFAVFYGQPVIQLFIGYQTVVNITGKQDLCYYNFLCAHSWGHLRAFNNVFSNLGYVLLGLLFIIIVGKRHLHHHRALEEQDKKCGIPKHFGLFYAMGTALVMEGVLSGCYHVCPKDSNFQFDTSFMYMMAGLTMLQLYQKRHPDITASSHFYFFLAAIVLIFVLIGEFSDKFREVGQWAFWIIFLLIHILVIVYLTMQLYYTSRWTHESGVLSRAKRCLRGGIRKCQSKVRVLLLLFGILVNIVLAFYGLIKKPEKFTGHLLHIAIGNQLLYLIYYMVMKCLSKEVCACCTCVPVCIWKWKLVIISILTGLMWVFAVYFFTIHVSQWEKTPAESRELNRDCYLLSFYDHHDVWHFFSASALFGTFLVLLIIDDNLEDVPRNKIRVF